MYNTKKGFSVAQPQKTLNSRRGACYRDHWQIIDLVRTIRAVAEDFNGYSTLIHCAVIVHALDLFKRIYLIVSERYAAACSGAGKKTAVSNP